MDEGIRWVVLTHEDRDRSADWYWAFGIAIVIGIGLSIYFANILLAIILALSAIAITILLVRGPREHEVHVHGRGVSVDGTLYPYQSLHSFWVAIEELLDEEVDAGWEPRAELRLLTTGYVHPHLILPLENVPHAEEVRDYLVNYMNEEEQEPRLTEHVAALLGF
jgi:hypothetical protein